MEIKIVVLKEGHLPEYKHTDDCCADCRASLNDTVIIAPRSMVTIPLGFKIGLPKGYEAQIRPRSGLARKNGVMAVFGTVDAGYIAEVGATLMNNSDIPFEINDGDRICQMKIEKKEDISFCLVEELEETERGLGGFGSTGIK